MRCRHHTKTSNYSSQKEDVFRRIKDNMGLPGNSGRIGVRTMCHTRWTIKVDALGRIISNSTVLRSTPDDAKDVDRARYGDEGKNSQHFVSNKQIPLPVRDHIGRTTDETHQQLELKSAAHVASANFANTNFYVVTVFGAMDIFHVKEYFLSLNQGQKVLFHVKEYFLSLNQGQRSYFSSSSSFSSFLKRMLHWTDCSLCYDISKATCAPRRCRNV